MKRKSLSRRTSLPEKSLNTRLHPEVPDITRRRKSLRSWITTKERLFLRATRGRKIKMKRKHLRRRKSLPDKRQTTRVQAEVTCRKRRRKSLRRRSTTKRRWITFGTNRK